MHRKRRKPENTGVYVNEMAATGVEQPSLRNWITTIRNRGDVKSDVNRLETAVLAYADPILERLLEVWGKLSPSDCLAVLTEAKQRQRS